MKTKRQAKHPGGAALKIRIESDFKQEVEAVAKRRRLTVSSLTRMLLQDYINRQGSTAAPSIEPAGEPQPEEAGA